MLSQGLSDKHVNPVLNLFAVVNWFYESTCRRNEKGIFFKNHFRIDGGIRHIMILIIIYVI